MPKCFLFLFVAFCFFACRSFRSDGLMTQVNKTTYNQIDLETYQIYSFKDLPRRIRMNANFRDQAVTTDTALFRWEPGHTSLFIKGAYDRKNHCGYVVQRFFTSDKGIIQQATLFTIKNKTIYFNFFNAPPAPKNWNDLLPFIKQDSTMLFGGGVAVRKKISKKR